MMLASDFPLLGVFWTILYVALWITFILTLFHVVGDVFRRRDLSGIQKAVWLVFVLFLPFIGVLTYVVVHGDVMTTPPMQARRANEKAARGYLHLRG
ncbi:MAG TPA: PLDc N-terminal domain-containing protein [Iamia sp.]